MLQQAEVRFGHALAAAGGGQGGDGGVQGLVGQGEGAPVDAQGLARTQVAEELHRLGRVGVLIAHEPARFVGTHRDQRQVQRREALAEEGVINHDDLKLFHWVETAEEAWDKVVEFYELD